MPQVLIRNVDKKTVDMLKDRAWKRGKSLQAELKNIIEEAINDSSKLTIKQFIETAADLRASLKGKRFTDSSRLIREDRD